MKRALVLVAFLLFLCTTAWAEGAGSAPAVDPRVAGGGCRLPDLSGLTSAQRAAAVLNAGLGAIYVDTVGVPACPTTFKCNSIAGCVAGSVCSATFLGPCCHDGGAVLCCQTGGDIVVEQCGCQCSGPLCASTACTSHSNVSVNCILVPAS